MHGASWILLFAGVSLAGGPLLAAESNRVSVDECDRLATSDDDPDRSSAIAAFRLKAIDAARPQSAAR